MVKPDDSAGKPTENVPRPKEPSPMLDNRTSEVPQSLKFI
jgi:hypothetical protein